MPIRIPDHLPAYSTLIEENIFVIPDDRAEHQDIRPLRIAILNLMPNKITTETQIMRLLSNTPIQVDVELMQVSSHKSKNTSAEHMFKFYRTFDEMRDERFDGLIVTGAPIELLNFENVDYWQELTEIFEWTKTHVFSTIHICWGAQAGLYYRYGVPKYDLPQKMFGVFPHTTNYPNHPLLRGFDDVFEIPHSRHTEIRREDVVAVPELVILAESPLAGVSVLCDTQNRNFFLTGHSEYDRMTLAGEYFRDINKGLDIALPYNYFPENNPQNTPRFSWCCQANLMYSNWLNYCVYQQTPFDLRELDNL